MVTNGSGPGGGRFSVMSSHSKGKSRSFLESRSDRRKGFGAALPLPAVCGEGATSKADWFPRHILPVSVALSTIGGLWLVYLVYGVPECFQALVSVYASWMFLIPAVGRGWACAVVTPSQGFVPITQTRKENRSTLCQVSGLDYGGPRSHCDTHLLLV